MPSLLSERLHQARHERFVGREKERALFRKALRAEALPFHLLYLYGPGGVGKTALLQELRYLCVNGLGSAPAGSANESANESANGSANGSPSSGGEAVAVHYLDARDVEPTPAAFRQVLERERPPEERDGRRFVLIIDTFEVFQPLERWFQEDFLPQLPLDTLVVVAGRTPPPAAWRSETGLQAVMRELPLRNLTPRQSRRYLARRGVPEAEREAVADFACGHPLALSLASDGFDQSPDQTFAPEATPELVKTLVQRFVQDVPSPAHRRALEACALVRSLSEALLEHFLQTTLEGHTPAAPEARALFEWLRTLSFTDVGPRGVFPHDLAREVLNADLRWRRPQRYDALHHAARRFYTRCLREARAPETSERVLTDYLFLYRDNPVVAPLFARLREQWEGRAFTAQPPRAADWPALRAMTRRHEGEASAALLDHWKDHPAARTTVFHDEEGAAAGFALALALHETTADDRARDPAVAAACRHLETHVPLRERERATLFRYWMDRHEHQALSPVQSLISSRRVRHYLSTPTLAFSFVTCAEPDRWALILAYADMEHLDEADYQIGECSFALFGHDWRATPPATWLDRMAERTITERAPEEVPPASPAPRLVLSREDFAEAVKEALKNFTRLDQLEQNPLARAALVEGTCVTEENGEERAERLQHLIREAAGRLRGTPRDEKFLRALDAAYLDPVGTQEEAAEALGAAFSTFRRHLGRAIAHVTEALWKRETGRLRAPGGTEQRKSRQAGA